jgi:16S rRNA (adenine1518-N6/adenine1519-N6)-dimethyltransferase
MSKFPHPSQSIKSDLRRAGTRPRKRLGQNFLRNPAVVQKIIAAAGLTPEDHVIEVGPGLGVLTRELVQHAGFVLAVELDGELYKHLQREFKPAGNIKIVHGNILKLDLAGLLEGLTSYKVVANLPYNITSPVLYYFMQTPLKPRRMVVMLQKEVADAIAAAAGDLSVLAIGVQIHARPAIIEYVPREDFYPVPKVDSAILSLEFLEHTAVSPGDQHMFMEVVRRGFRAPRKHLRNSLSLGLNLKTAETEAILKEAGISPLCRPADVLLPEWQKLLDVILARGVLGKTC